MLLVYNIHVYLYMCIDGFIRSITLCELDLALTALLLGFPPTSVVSRKSKKNESY